MSKFDEYLEMSRVKASDFKDTNEIQKWGKEIADLRSKEREVQHWYYNTRGNDERKMDSQKRYWLEGRWERAYEKAKKSPKWNEYVTEKGLVKDYDFGDVLA
jgi:hypothetical protein